MEDARDDLRLQLCNILISHGVKDAAVEVDFILNKYEIMHRTTEVALLEEDRNEYLFRRFLIAKTVGGCSQRTITFYGKTLRFVFDRLQKNADDVTAEDIRYYLAVRQRTDKVNPTTADNELRIMKSFYSWLLQEEIVSRNPTLKVDKIKRKKVKKEAFTDMELEKLRDILKNTREKAIFELLLSTGCRVNELVNIKLSDINGNKITILGKGNKERIVYMNARAILAVEKYISERSDSNPYLFCGGVYCQKELTDKLNKYGISGGEWYKDPELVSPDKPTDRGSIEQLMRKLKKRAGLETGCYPHKFRRTCATMALRRGMPIEQVSRMLGHEEISTTQIYLDLDDSELEQAHKKYVT